MKIGDITAHFPYKIILNTNKNMKAIIIAAGQGSRLMPITKDKPKCMLE